jgi:hypothetical protein
MNFTTTFMESSLLLWPLVIVVAHSIWSIWYSSTQSKTYLGDLKDKAVMNVYGMAHVFQALDLALNESIQQGLSPTIGTN